MGGSRRYRCICARRIDLHVPVVVASLQSVRKTHRKDHTPYAAAKLRAAKWNRSTVHIIFPVVQPSPRGICSEVFHAQSAGLTVLSTATGSLLRAAITPGHKPYARLQPLAAYSADKLPPSACCSITSDACH